MATPRSAQIVQTPVLAWSDGTIFNGYWLVELVPPSDGVTPWLESDLSGFSHGIKMPQFSVLPIIAGVFNASLGLWYTSDLSIPNCKYQAWLYDSTNRQIAGPTALFTITSSPYNPALAAPTAPNQSATAVSPDS